MINFDKTDEDEQIKIETLKTEVLSERKLST